MIFARLARGKPSARAYDVIIMSHITIQIDRLTFALNILRNVLGC